MSTIIDTNTKDALATANNNIREALAALDRRFESVNQFNAQLDDARAVFARKTDIDSLLLALEKSQLKAEKAIEDRFHAVNEFRAQLAAQHDTFARKAEISQAMEAFEKSVTKAENATEKDSKVLPNFARNSMISTTRLRAKPKLIFQSRP